MWIRDEKQQQAVGLCVLLAYAAATVYGVSREGEAAWPVIKVGLAVSLLVAAAALAFVTRRFESAMIYYRTGSLAATIGRRGLETEQYGSFLEELAKQMQAAGPPKREKEPNAG